MNSVTNEESKNYLPIVYHYNRPRFDLTLVYYHYYLEVTLFYNKNSLLCCGARTCTLPQGYEPYMRLSQRLRDINYFYNSYFLLYI